MALTPWLSAHATLWLSLYIDASAKAALVLAVTAGASLLFKQASAAWRHQVWMLAVCAALAFPVLSALVPAWRMRPVSPLPAALRAGPPPPQPEMAGRAVLIPPGAAASARPEVSTGRVARAGFRFAGAALAEVKAVRPRVQLSPPLAVLVGWAVGAALTLLPLLAGVARARRIAQRAQPLEGGGVAGAAPGRLLRPGGSPPRAPPAKPGGSGPDGVGAAVPGPRAAGERRGVGARARLAGASSRVGACEARGLPAPAPLLPGLRALLVEPAGLARGAPASQ